MNITPRLAAVCDFVKNGSRIADIGTDHAYIPIFLTKEGRIEYAVASDINEGPIKAAQKNIKSSALYIRTCLAGGTAGIDDNEVDTLIIAGMGGDLISDILKERIPRGVEHIIVQPMTHIKDARITLNKLGFCIAAEKLVKEGKRLYTVISAEVGEQKFSDLEYEFSPMLKNDPLFPELLRREAEKTRRSIAGLENSADTEKKAEFSAKLSYIEKLEEDYE